MSLWNKNAIAAIAALPSVAIASHVIGAHAVPEEMQGSERRNAAVTSSSLMQILVASSQYDDWTAWGGAFRGSPALRHGDRERDDLARQRSGRRPSNPRFIPADRRDRRNRLLVSSGPTRSDGRAVSGQVDNRRSRLGSYISGDSVGGRAHGGISHIARQLFKEAEIDPDLPRGGYFKGTPACLSALYAARRHE